MASSKVEIASSSPFGCVLRDHNRRDDNGRGNFQKNLKDRNHKKAKISREMVCSMLQIDNDDFFISSEYSSSDDTNQKKSEGRETEQTKSDDKNHNKLKIVREMVRNPLQFDNADRSVHGEESNHNDNNHKNEKNQKKSKIHERWARAREKVCNQPQNDNADCSFSIEESNEKNAREEKEKLRVVDIIRKLTSVNKSQQGCGDEICEVEQTLSSNESLPRVGTEVVLCCPRIRGRQAFSNLLMQIERDRHRELEGLVERKPVSKFPHRGRIQALLRVRFMRHVAETRDRATSSSIVSSQSNRAPQGSNIMHLRERFCTGVEHGATDPKSTCREVVDSTPDVEKASASNKEVVENTPNTENSTSHQIKEESRRHSGTNSRNSCRSIADNTQDAESSSTSNQLREEIHHHDFTNPKNSHKDVVHNTQVENSSTINQLKEESHSFSNRLKESKSCEDVATNVGQNSSKIENQATLHEVGTDIVCQGISYDVSNSKSLESAHAVSSLEDEANDEQRLGSNHSCIKDTSHAQTIWEDLESCHDWLSDISQLQSEWEQMCNDQQLIETNNDWISDVARPRSDWEDLRQARYQEMLDPYSDNGDIRQLLERKSVSSFLSSNMRDTIDRLMISRTQKQENQMGSLLDKGKEGVEEERHDEVKYRDDSSDENEEDGRPIERQYNELSKYADQTSPVEPHSQSLLSSWSDIQDNEVSDYFDQVASPTLQKYVSSNSSSRENQQCSSFMNSPSIEMELIYDLRGHMEQLHQEISEIRKSLKNCINMQVKLQRSIKQEVASAVKRSVRKEGKESTRRAIRKGRCCVCNTKRVDSLLYRCGHMCTCFKCAHDLQMSTGKCPICQSPILDIVRPYADAR